MMVQLASVHVVTTLSRLASAHMHVVLLEAHDETLREAMKHLSEQLGSSLRSSSSVSAAASIGSIKADSSSEKMCVMIFMVMCE